MVVYKIIHRPTGLFYTPSRRIKINGTYKKSNLSKKGKIYFYKPSEKQIKCYTDFYHDEKGILHKYSYNRELWGILEG